jgi:hypothetical protein
VHRSVGNCLAMSVAALFSTGCEKGSTEGGAAGAGALGAEKAAAPMMDMPSTSGGTVPCLGIHECKGKSACHVVGGHACAGQNTCKGKGWIQVPRAECDAKGGKVIDT